MKNTYFALLSLVYSISALGLPGCEERGEFEDQDFVVLNVVSQQGTPLPVNEVHVILNEGEDETFFDLGGLFVMPLASSGETFTLGLDFPEEFRGQEVSLEVIGLQDGLDVFSGEISAIVDGTGRLNSVFVQFCGNEIEDLARAEECDDANDVEGDGCDSNCTVSACGNGIFAPGELCFAPPVEFPVGDGPRSLAVGDFNGDAFQDLATANFDSDNVTVLFGDGGGSFGNSLDLQVGDGPNSLKAEDFDRDDNLDLVTTNEGSDNLSVLLNNGDKTFQSQLTFEAGFLPVSVVVDDLNFDSTPDLVVASLLPGTLDNNINFFVGNGDGTFQIQNGVTLSLVTSLATGNFNNDGFLDIAVSTTAQNLVPGKATVFLGSLIGFGSQQPQTVGIGPSSTFAEDFNLDNFLDLAVSNGSSNSVSLLTGNGDGTFQPSTNLSVGEGPGEVLAKDFNLDGFLDLVVANSLSGDISVLLGNGDGTFQSQQIFPGGGSVLVSGDLNGDGLLDLATNSGDGVGVLLFNP